MLVLASLISQSRLDSVCRPIQVVTGPAVEQLRWSTATLYHDLRQTTTEWYSV